MLAADLMFELIILSYCDFYEEFNTWRASLHSELAS